MEGTHENGHQASEQILDHTNGQAEAQQNESCQLKVFKMYRGKMERGMTLEISDLSSRCWAAGLIGDRVHNKQFDGESEPEMTRTEQFYTNIYEKLKGYETAKKPDEATKLIQGIANIVGSDSALKHMAQTISK